MRGLDLPALDRRLRPDSPAPLAVAFSGGGDSLALLRLTRAWADVHGRRLLVLTVDHGLNPASPGWTDHCRAVAGRLGLAFQALRWTGDKPTAGLPAAARAARHALLADAAREAGAKVILMGHTADDLAEAAAMRAEGSTVSDPGEWGPSPAWPQGRDVFLLRPMLTLRRAALRAWLRDQGETWIEDPANDDLRFARARARRAGSMSFANGSASARAASQPDPGRRSPDHAESGLLDLPRAAPAAMVAAACLCAAGTARPPRGDRLERLAVRLRSGEAFAATLAGARVETAGDRVLFTREAGRGGPAPLALPPGRPAVWDGRFELVADRPGLIVRGLSGLTARLPAAERRRLRDVPVAARSALPVLAHDGLVTCPILAERPSVRVRALVVTRFEAATGCVDFEPGV